MKEAQAIEQLRGLVDTKATWTISAVVRKYAATVGDNDTAQNFTVAGLGENEAAIEVAIETVKYLKRLDDN